MLLKSISDIGNDAMTIELEQLGFRFGVMNMVHVYLLVEEYIGRDGEQVAMLVSERSVYEVARTLLALAIINHACIFHEDFEMPMLESNMTVHFRRQHSVENHRTSRSTLLKQISEIAEKYPL